MTSAQISSRTMSLDKRVLFALACDFFDRIVGVVDRMPVQTWKIRNLSEQLPRAAAVCLCGIVHALNVGGDKWGYQRICSGVGTAYLHFLPVSVLTFYTHSMWPATPRGRGGA
jgi:hypothetical protein